LSTYRYGSATNRLTRNDGAAQPKEARDLRLIGSAPCCASVRRLASDYHIAIWRQNGKQRPESGRHANISFRQPASDRFRQLTSNQHLGSSGRWSKLKSWVNSMLQLASRTTKSALGRSTCKLRPLGTNRRAPIDAFEQHRKLRRRECRCGASRRRGPNKATLLKPLGKQT